MKKAQVALEYLIVYGWVFLVIVIVGGALYLLGIFNPDVQSESLTEKSFEALEVGILDHRLLTTGTWTLNVYPRGANIRITSVEINNQEFYFDNYISNGQSETITGTFDSRFVKGTDYLYDLYINYDRLDTGLNHTAIGLFAGKVELGYYSPGSPLTVQESGSFYQSSYFDFSQGATSGTNIDLQPDKISLNLKNDWYNQYFKYRKDLIITEKSGNDLINYPISFTLDTNSLISNSKMKSDASDLRIINNGMEVPYQIEQGTLNTDSTKIWIIINLTSYDSETLHLYYGNSLAITPNYETDLNYKSGTTGYFENNKIYAHIGSDNNPTSFGFDTIYEKSTGIDLVNYYSYLFNRNSLNNHYVGVTQQGPIFIEFNVIGFGDEKNNGPLVYRLYSNNNFIRWLYDDNISSIDNFWLGKDNSVINSFETNGEVHILSNQTITNYYNINYSYIRAYNFTTDYGITIFSPIKLNTAVTTGSYDNNIDEYMTMYDSSSQLNVPYFDYYVGILNSEQAKQLSEISTNLPTSILSNEQELYLISGTFTSVLYDTGINNPDYEMLTYYATLNNGNVRIKIRSGSTEEECGLATWRGPTSETDYYSHNRTISTFHDGDRWIQYKIYLTTSDTIRTPLFDAINISYS